MSNILVVDDEPGIRESLNVFLTGEGHAIDTACNGREALNCFEQKTYDLVLTDLTMPEMDGMALVKEIKERFKNRVSVIVITAHSNVQRAVLAIKEGAADYLVKPYDINRLRESVENVLQQEKKNLHAELQRREVETQHLRNLNQKLDRTIFELSILHEIGKTVNSTLDINKIVSVILEMARQTVTADHAALALYHRDSTDIKHHLHYLAVGEAHTSELTPLDQRAMQWVTQNKQPLLIEDLKNSPQFKNSNLDFAGLTFLMAVPLKRKSQVLGAIVLANHGGSNRFLQEDLRFISTLANQAAIAIENGQLYEEMQDFFADTIRSLIAAVEAKDTYTYGHSARVTRYSLLIADQLGLTSVEMRRLEYLSLLHDVGKIGIDESILRKNSNLDAREWEIIKNHPIIGGNIIKPIKFLPAGEKIIRHHHEHYNGSGYPDGLQGEGIPLFSRIIAVADSFDAMTSLRPYRQQIQDEQAIEELRRCSGKQFDPKLVSLFIQAYAREKQGSENKDVNE